jgi:hypothetical protein
LKKHWKPPLREAAERWAQANFWKSENTLQLDRNRKITVGKNNPKTRFSCLIG